MYIKISISILLAISLNLLAFLAPGSTLWGPDLEPIDRAVAQMDEDSRKRYIFRQVTQEEDRTRLEGYDVEKPTGQRWSLIAVNGQPPSLAQRAVYARREDKRDLNLKRLRAAIIAASVRISEENKNRLTYRFELDTASWGRAQSEDRVTGEIVLNKATQEIIEIEVVHVIAGKVTAAIS
jgi:hypothetical protein